MLCCPLYFYTFLTIYFQIFLEVKFISKIVDKKVDNLVNEEITAEKVLVISETGEQLGELAIEQALVIADERGYDLVCVAPNAKTPVCKLMDYSKYRYDQIKKAKEAKKNQKIISVKEVRLSPTIDTNDYETKARAARKFLTGGDKVKVSCRFKGRMIDQANNTKGLFIKFATELEDIAKIDQQPVLDGRNMTMMLSPITVKKNQK